MFVDEKKIDKKAVGKKIRQIRTSRGYTLQGFGDLLGASRGNVQYWENGHCLPNKKRLAIISKLGNMTVTQLLYGATNQDIEELYEQLIRLSNDEILNIMERVAEYMKERKNDYRKH